MSICPKLSGSIHAGTVLHELWSPNAERKQLVKTEKEEETEKIKNSDHVMAIAIKSVSICQGWQ